MIHSSSHRCQIMYTQCFINIFPKSPVEIFEASDHLVAACTGKSQLGIGFVAPPPEFHPCFAAVVFYNGSEEDGKKIVDYEAVFGGQPPEATS